jgi:hypothetical protein
MALRESGDAALLRWRTVEALQEHYAQFDPFLMDVMELLGFDTSPVQRDIGSFLCYGPDNIMIQAQRGQAKTTITAAFAVWTLIQNPSARVLILSAGGTQANEISTLIVRILMQMEELEALRPDASNGDRTSVEAFDIHYTLKGIDKSPSVACIGITGNMQGKRADLLIADDIESAKNSKTALMREQLMDLTRDFTSICTNGRIVYLGTPQSMESVYNTLPARGFTVRIWPGRFPNPEQLENYGEHLAPYIRNRLLKDPGLAFGGGMLGDQGQPIDPTYIGEATLQFKELDQGPSYFQLQHMLNTKLADAARYPLKVEQIVMMDGLGSEYYPLEVVRGFGGGSLKDIAIFQQAYKINTPVKISEDVAKLQGKVMYVDPAGGGKNGDETAYAVTGFLNGNIYVLAVGGVPGGYNIDQMTTLANIAERWKVNKIIVEKNMGYGAFTEVWLPVLRQKYECAVEDDFVTGQKETRIIETLEPVIARGSLILNSAIIDEERESLLRYPAAQRQLYSFFHQLSKITRDRDCLNHDDRVDALEGAVRYWLKVLAIDQSDAIKRARDKEYAEAMRDPMMKDRWSNTGPSRGGSVFNKYLRSNNNDRSYPAFPGYRK